MHIQFTQGQRHCRHCSAPFSPRQNSARGGTYCGHACHYAARSNRVTRRCVGCGITILVRGKTKPRQGRFCSLGCFGKHRTSRKAITARFWGNVLKTDTCWIWQGSRHRRGYGRFAVTSAGVTKTRPAHRFAWEIAKGPIPRGLLVCHHCDNPACVRPGHLFLGTNADNMADMKRKARSARGERNKAAKLTETQVREIRRRYRFGGPVKALARQFGVCVTTIQKVARGRRWNHVGAPR